MNLSKFCFANCFNGDIIKILLNLLLIKYDV